MKKYTNFKINEIDFNIMPTGYDINNINKFMKSYSFISNAGNSYSVYFLQTIENDTFLDDGTKLSDYIDINSIIITIFFSLTERDFNPLIFDNLVNKNEYLEIMGKVVYIILEYINENNLKIFSIGEVNQDKYNFYNHYKKFFNEFELKIGKTKNYGVDSNAYYLIKMK